MFEKTRKKLTLMYSSMLALILIAVFVGFYWTLSAIIDRNEHAQLEAIGEKAAHEWDESREKKLFERSDEDSPVKVKMDFDFLPQNQIFMIATDNQWIVKTNSKHDNGISSAFQQAVMADPPEEGSLKHVSLSNYGETRVFAVYRPFTEDDDTRLYLGEDVSRMDQLLQQMKWALLVIGILLLGVTTLIGYWFSGRAMVPINLSYKRQKDFTTDASHELRTPLSVILSSAEILQEKKELLPTFHQTVLQNMLEEIHRMSRLIDALLTLARSDVENDQKLTFQQFDLVSLMTEVADRMQIMASRKEVKIVNRAEHESAPFFGHSDSLRQLFYILLDNAVKYSEQGGQVEINVVKEGPNRVVCSVRDFGKGIPQEDLPYVFERFYRADKSRSREVEGTGLGLAIASQIVKMHKGQISVSSSQEQGTQFTVVFPINPPRGDKLS